MSGAMNLKGAKTVYNTSVEVSYLRWDLRVN